MDRNSIKKKIIDKILPLLYWKMHSNNFNYNNWLFDFVAFIYIFYDKNKFTNYKKVEK